MTEIVVKIGTWFLDAYKSTKDWELTSWVDFFGIRRIT